MNTRLYDQLQEWVADKPSLLGLLAITAVFSCDTFHSLLTSDEGKELLRRYSAREDEAWAKYYTSPIDSFSDWLQTLHPRSDQLSPGIIATCQKIGQDDKATLGSVEADSESIYRKLEPQIKKLCQELIKILATEEDTPLDAKEQERLSRNPAVCFFLRVTIPCCLRYRATPQNLYTAATCIDRPNWKSLDKLIEIDPEIIYDPVIRAVLHSNDRQETARRFCRGASHLMALSRPPNLKSLKAWAAGFVLQYSDCVGSLLQGPDIRQLFDYAAVSQSKEKILSDPDLPASSEALAKMLQRKRIPWRLILPPDKDIIKIVQALRDDAA